MDEKCNNVNEFCTTHQSHYELLTTFDGETEYYGCRHCQAEDSELLGHGGKPTPEPNS